MSKILHLRVENILGLHEADLTPYGESVVIGGRNGMGKSSLQQAVKMMVGGASECPAEPVHRGEKKGTGHLETTDGYLVDYEVKPDRSIKLKVTHREKPGWKSDNVSIVKALFGPHFDPSEFHAAPPKAKLETLMKLAKVDLGSLNAKRDKVFAERTGINRDVKTLEGQLAGITVLKDAPEHAPDTAADLAELEAIKEHNHAIQEASAEEDRCIALRAAKLDQIRKLQAEVAALDAKIGLELPEVRDPAPVKARIAGAQVQAAAFAAKQRHDDVARRLATARGLAESATEALAKIDADKTAALVAAKLPIAGLSVDETTVRYNGTPLEQCSESEGWRVAVAIGFALNPAGVLFMAKSGGMDLQSRASVLEQAKVAGVQLFLEVFDDPGDVTVLIEQGVVAENRLAAAEGRG